MKLTTLILLLEIARRAEEDNPITRPMEKVTEDILEAISIEEPDNTTSDLCSACADYVCGNGSLAAVMRTYERIHVA